MRIVPRLFLVALLLVFQAARLAPAGAQTQAQPQPAAAAPSGTARNADAPGPPAAVVVFNRSVVVFRETYLGFSAAERAALARERIQRLLERPGPGKVGAQPSAEGVRISIDDTLAFVVTRGDAAAPNEETLQALAAQSADTLRRVIAETRELRDTRAMLTALALALVVSLVCVALIWALYRAWLATDRRFVQLTGPPDESLRLSGMHWVKHWLLRLLRRAVGALFVVVGLLVGYEWLSRVLALFPFTRPWGERLNGFLVQTATDLLVGIAGAVPQLLIAVVIFLIARSINAVLSSFFDRVQWGHIGLGWLDADTVRPTRRLVTLAVWLLALVMAYPYLPGAETEAFKGLSVLVGLMLSIGGASVAGQAFSGIILVYARSFRVGDYVRIDHHEGTVVEMGMYQTRIRTGLGEELVLPNSMVLGTVTRNYSSAVRGPGFVLDTAVTVGYGTPWRQVHAMLVEAAQRTPGVAAAPAPRVFQTALSDFYVEYRLVAQALPSEPVARAETLSALRQNILDAFNEHGVPLMSPHYLGDPAEAKLVPKARWYEAPAQRPDPDAPPTGG